MNRFIRMVVRDYGWIHLALGLIGNITFFVGSILFLPQFDQYKTTAIWFFICGSLLMLVGAAGRLLVDLTGGDN